MIVAQKWLRLMHQVRMRGGGQTTSSTAGLMKSVAPGAK
jgi:hypothetical protein